jgi:hypothetical protein
MNRARKERRSSRGVEAEDRPQHSSHGRMVDPQVILICS